MKSLRKKFKVLSLLLALALPSFSLLGDLNNGLVAWYPFDGNASDMSGNGNHGTVYGATLSTDRHGEANKAYSFDGINDYVEGGNIVQDYRILSFCAWFKISEGVGTNLRGIISKQRSTGGSGSLLAYIKDTSELYGGTFNYSQEAKFSINSKNWAHGCFTSDAVTAKLFYNGNLVAFDSISSTSETSSTSPILIGKELSVPANDGERLFMGSIDDIRIYDRALSAEEVSTLYRLESPNHFAEMNSSVNMEMIWVEPGAFTMGQFGVVGPEHNVTLTKGFYLGKYEVTQAQYEAVMTGNTDGLSATPSMFGGNPNRPVEKVSHNDIQIFLQRLNEKEADNLPGGWKYVLPTEAQWEYACRAGTTTVYSWGNTLLAENANWNHGSDANQTVDFGQYLPNAWGLYDMHGNVYEWTADWHAPYTSNAKTDPEGPESGAGRSNRGGSWTFDGTHLPVARRFSNLPTHRFNYIGFRLSLQYANKSPYNLNSTAELTIAENQPIGTIEGEFNAIDPEGGVVTYHFVNGENNNSFFTLDSNGTLKTATVFDYEADSSSYTITVQAKDELNATVEGNFTVILLDVYEDTDGDGFRDSLEVSTGSDLNDPNSTPLEQGLVAWYPFDGNASDMSGNGNHGTVHGAYLASDRHGQSNNAYNFDGVNDYVEVMDSDNFDFGDQGFSVSAWTKKFSQINSNVGAVVSQWNTGGSPGSNEWILSGSASGSIGRPVLSVEISNQSKSAISPDIFGLNQWSNLIGVHDGSKIILYMDGVKVAENLDAIGIVNETGSNLFFGKYRDSNPIFSNISIDDVRVYDRALSAEEIQLLYQAEAELPAGSVTSAKLSPALSDLIDGNGSLEQAIPAGSVIARKPGETPPPGYTLFQRNEYNASLVWEEKAPVSVARRVYDGAVSLNGKIYLAGGYNSTDAFNIFETYDPLSNQWQTLPSLSEARVGLACAILEGKIFAISGHGKSSVEIYDPVANEWTSGPSLPEPIRYAEAITIDGRLFVMGGMNESDQNTNQVLELEKSTNQWITRAPMLRYTRGHRLVQVDGKIWAVGGYDSVGSDGSHSNKVEIYDPVNNSWEEGVPLNTARHFPNVWVSHGKVFAGGGFGGTFLNSVEVYNPVLNQWTLIGSLPESKFRAATVVNNHKVYIIAGEINSAVYSNKVYAVDLPAPAMNLYFKEGNLTAEAELSTLGMADGSVTLGQLAPDSLAKIGLDHNPATAEGSLFAVPWGTKALPGYSLYKRFDVSGSLKWEEKAPVIVPRWAFDGVEALDGKIYFVGGKDGAVRNIAERYDPATNQWESLTPMTEARDGMAAAVLNGKFYAIAGRTNNSVEIYDPQTEQWSLGPALPVPLYSAAAITINEKILVIGGYNSGNLNLVYEYESATNQWSQKASMPTARYGHKLAFANGKVWAIGGSSAKTVEIYDVANNTWSSGPSLSKNRFHTIAWSVNDIIYVAGGSNDNTIEIYDPERNQWVDAGFLPEKKYTSDATVLNGKVYLVSGHNSSAYSENVHAADLNPPMDLYYREANASGTITLDKLSTELAGEFASSSAVSAPAGLVTAVDCNDDYPSDHTILERTDRNATHEWEEMAPVSVARYAFDGLEVYEEKIYFAGGYTSSNSASNIFESYDPSNDQWTTLTPMSVSRSGLSASFYNGKFYVFGGYDGSTSNVYASGEVYDLASQTWTAIANMPYAKASMTAITYNGLIYCMGGWTAGVSNTGHVLVYDPLDNSWTQLADMPSPRHGFKLVILDDKIWAIGGSVSESSYLNIVESFDPITDLWKTEESMNSERHWPVAWVEQNRIFVGGGRSSSGHQKSIEYYDLEEKLWIQSGEFPQNSYAGDSAVINGMVYVAEASAASGQVSSKVYAADLLPHRDLYFRSVASETVNRGPSAVYAVDALSASENQIVGTIVGEFNATDPDGDSVTYFLVSGAGDTHNALFTLDQNGTLKVAGALDYETADSLSIRVQAKDELNATKEGNFAVTLTDVYEDTDGDGFRDSLEASTGSDLNEPNSTPLQQGLVAWYPFDGNVSDMSGKGNDLFGSGHSFGFDRYGESGKSCRLDQVHLSDTDASFSIDDNDSFSYSLWVQINSVPSAYPEAFGLRDITGNWETLRIGTYHIQDQNKFAVDHLSTGTNSSHVQKAWADSNTQIGRWYQIAVVSTLSEVKLFIDSSMQSKVPFQRDAGRNNQVAIYVGGANTWNLFDGSVDDIRIYDRALSADEVSALYRLESPNHFAGSADHLEMIWVEPGTFTMGQNDISNASPEHNVTLTQEFYLGKYEVTQAQYEAVMRGNTNGLSATPSQFSGNPSFPVEKVSLNDIQVFLTRLNEQEADNLPQGWTYALPTEAEWEYACRAGTNTAYSWGDTIGTTDANWNHGNDANRTEKVGSYPPNPWGFYDMHGNVCELVADRYANYNPNIVFDPQGALTGHPVRRSGSWNMQGNFLLSSSRSFNNPSFRGVWVGFRLALKKVSFTPLTDDNFRTAIDLWFSDEAAAIETYSHISNWDVSQVTDFSGIFRERDTFQ
jgi:formylglycine-generating enzyme required for sulfatase activity/N-acetylneuraminic acid mutarotase